MCLIKLFAKPVFYTPPHTLDSSSSLNSEQKLLPIHNYIQKENCVFVLNCLIHSWQQY